MQHQYEETGEGPAMPGDKAESKDLDLLFIEDEDLFGRATARDLRRHWRRVDWVCSIGEAMDKLRVSHYDAVLTDLDCPNEGDGLHMLEVEGLPVVVQTGRSYAVVPNVQVLDKSASVNEFTDALLRAIRKGRA